MAAFPQGAKPFGAQPKQRQEFRELDETFRLFPFFVAQRDAVVLLVQQGLQTLLHSGW